MAGEFGKLQPVQFVAIAIGLTLSACAGRDPQPIATVQALLANHHRRRAGENRPQPFARGPIRIADLPLPILQRA
jgi:hypothetical protein